VHGEDSVGNPVTFTLLYSMIYLSNDGRSWRKVHETAGTGSPFDVMTTSNAVSLVWNSQRNSFFYDENSSTSGAGGETIEKIFSSSSGSSWSAISSTPISGEDYKSVYPPTYCKDNDCFDALGQHVPDGVMDEELDKIKMQPEQPPTTFYENGTHSFSFSSGDEGTDGSNKVKIKITTIDESGTKNVTQKTVAIPGIQKVMCVGGIGNTWMAGGFAGKDFDGGGAVALTTDQGMTWKSIFSSPQPILTLSAAPSADI
jgi:hypothetical protein